ncbi:hypothetical protein AM501_23275 [Aneurinibacillus migulanus]|nr:hypothetical protein TS64_16535 [Aneurinibacillus migulanus]KPD05965.1 hypothetical protein AM501_23275 [Aneurinibacillus migulanus]
MGKEEGGYALRPGEERPTCLFPTPPVLPSFLTSHHKSLSIYQIRCIYLKLFLANKYHILPGQLCKVLKN